LVIYGLIVIAGMAAVVAAVVGILWLVQVLLKAEESR
jgi:hypothetical protein